MQRWHEPEPGEDYDVGMDPFGDDEGGWLARLFSSPAFVIGVAIVCAAVVLGAVLYDWARR